jgi:hypothetical protein
MMDVSRQFRPDVAAAERGVPNTSGRFSQTAWYGALAAVVVVVAFLALQGWKRDFRVPISFSSDALVYEMLSKGTADHGWWWVNPSISAPSRFQALAFPSNSNVDQALVWLFSRFTGEIGYYMNCAWIAMLVAAGCSAAFCAVSLGLSRSVAFVVGLLFAFSPYGLYRGIDHFSLAIYLIPFPATAALLAINGRTPEGWLRRILIAGCILIGLNYVYYAFFSVFFLVLAGAAGYISYRSKRVAVFVGICTASVILVSALNLAPSIYVWARDGKPRILRAKTPAESEVYGLKIRQLVSPVFEHSIPPFLKWTEREAAAQFPLETENMISRLGFIPTLGFLVALGGALLWRNSSAFPEELTPAAGRLIVGGLLLATTGGFGSLFALLVSPDIRAYNRIAGFLAFFSLVAAGAGLERFRRFVGERFAWHAGAAATLGAVALFGIYDQAHALQSINRVHARVAQDFGTVEQYVKRLEQLLPPGSAVYQLPFRTYLNDDGIGRMKPYDHARLYLVSHGLRWSYPALSTEQVDYQERLATLAPTALLQNLKNSGFSAVVIDRYGYTDAGSSTSGDFEAALGTGSLISSNERFAAWRLNGPIAVPAAAPPVTTSVVPAQSAATASCGGPPLLNVDVVGGVRAPFVGKDVRVKPGNTLEIAGWAVDQTSSAPAGGVEIAIDGKHVVPASYGIARADVAAYFKQEAYRPTGFSAVAPAALLEPGYHTLVVRALSPDRKCFREGPPIQFEVR